MKKSIIYIFVGLCAFAATYALAATTKNPIVIQTVLFAFIIQWVLYIPAYLFKTEKFFDLAGSLTYIFVVSYTLYKTDNFNLGSIMLASCIIIWAVRLGSFLFFRIKKAGQDKRFVEIKKSFGRFFMTWSLQGMWVSICSLCAITAIANTTKIELNTLFYIGLIVFILGFIIEVIADNQKTAFRNNPANKHKFISSGLWSYSRHPNYLGEIILWSGIAIMSFGPLSGFEYLTLISPIFTYLLLVYVSGIRLLEDSGQKKWGDLKEYQDYVKNTPALLIK